MKKKFNKLRKFNKKNIAFTKFEIIKNIKKLDSKVKSSIDIAYNRILSFHKNQKSQDFKTQDKYKNIFSYRSNPLERVGVYVPGGSASYPSSVLMNCIPAMVAGGRNFYDRPVSKWKN